MNTSPDEPSIGIDVDFGDAEPGGRKILLFVYSAGGGIELAPGASVMLKPGGLHIMLMGLRAPLKTGETLELRLTFETSDEMKITVPIGGVAANSPDQAAGSSGN